MDKNAIKKYAIWARNELIARIAQKALRYGISKDSIVDAYADSIDGVLLSAVEKRQRQALIAQIEAKGFEQVVEEVAYTWFNRFCALRFMEVNGYLPSNIRVLSDEGNDFKPEILTKAIELDFESLNMETVYAFKEANKDEELYRYLLIVQCNELNKILPHMFQKLEDYTELLLPDNLLRDGSVIEQLVTTIPQEDFDINKGGQVEIIGWLYQYYNTEPKAETFALLKKNVKITKERIPSATQLFTPDWIVRYMVENSLGRIWVEGHPNDELKGNWKYYLDEAKQEEAVEAELAKIRAEYANLNPKDIKVIDPCMGSGHILVYAFDVLMQIYISVGYTEKEAAISILENNLYGLDIDERAFQLAYFAVMMKARQYHKFILKKRVQCNIHPIVESNGINVEQLHYFGVQLDEFSKNAAITQMQGLISQMHDAKEYGSIITVDNYDWELLLEYVDEFDISNGFNLFNASGIDETQKRLKELVAVGEVLAKKYEVVVTNPPYMGVGGMSNKLAEYIKCNFVDGKNDFFSVFIQRCNDIVNKNGITSMITMESWMFLSSFEKLRKNLLKHNTIINLLHMPYLGKGGTSLGINFGTDIAIILNKEIQNYEGQYQYVTYLDTNEDGVPKNYPVKNNRWKNTNQTNFAKLPGSPIAYWVSKQFTSIFEHVPLQSLALVQEGLKTGDNERFIRKWYEVNFNDFGKFDSKWFYHTKGGNFRKWYGNQEDVVNYYNEGEELRKFATSSLTGKQNYFKKNITYSRITSAKTSFRFTDIGSIPNMAGLAIYCDDYILNYVLGLLNTDMITDVLSIINPTINFPPGLIAKLPIKIQENRLINVNEKVKENIEISKYDWDSYETSWEFKKHPLI